MATQRSIKEKNTNQPSQDTKSLGSYYEVVDFANDPIIHLFYAHIRAGLNAFQNDVTGNPDAAIRKYKFMLRLGETLLGEKFGFDFVKFRRELEQRKDLSEGEKLMEEMKQISRLLENRVRKVEIVLHFAKSDVMDFAKELLKQDEKADELDEELSGAEEEVVIKEEEVLDTLNEDEEVSVEAK